MSEAIVICMMLDKVIKTSHIKQHLDKHHKGVKVNLRESFQFEVVSQIKGAMNRQIAEVLLIKNSKSQLMNDRDMYTRCILPEIPKMQRGKVSKEPSIYSQGYKPSILPPSATLITILYL